MSNSEQVEAVDHRDWARQWLDAADREASTHENAKTPPIPLAEAFAAVAQVHATLALADEVRISRESFEGAVDAILATADKIAQRALNESEESK